MKEAQFTEEEIKRIKSELEYDLETSDISIEGNTIHIVNSPLGFDIEIRKYMEYDPRAEREKTVYSCLMELWSEENEIPNPSALVQHGYIESVDLEDMVPENIIRVCEDDCRKQIQKKEYIGSLRECVEECIWECYCVPKYEEQLDNKYRLVEDAPVLKFKPKGYDVTVTVSPIIKCEVCYVNITHYHYFLGYTIHFVTDSLDKLIELINKADKLTKEYDKKHPMLIRELYKIEYFC